MKAAVDELGHHETFRGYGPEQGYHFLRAAIADGDYRDNGISVEDDEIFVSDGSKCDTGNILDIFGNGNKIAITDPVYPVYVDTNVMAGNTGEANESGAYEGIHYMPCHAENGFVPEVAYPGATAKDVEKGVLIPVEEALEGLSGIKKINSDGERNRARFWFQAEKGTDLELYSIQYGEP